MAFRISDTCIACGTRAANCPVQCISEGTPFSINESECIDCGTCAANCPVEAIHPAEE